MPPSPSYGVDRIQMVENNLSRRQVIRGAPDTLSLKERMVHYGVPGVVVAVIDANQVSWVKSYGHIERGKERLVDEDTLFQAGSISKPVTAIAVLRLTEQGVFDLDVDVNRYLKAWQIPENEFTRDKPVTLRALLSHRGGTTVSGFPGYEAGSPAPSIVQVLDGAAPANTEPVVVTSVPDSQPTYSGGGFSIVQLAIRDSLDAPFAETLERLVLEPASMRSSTFEQPLPSSLYKFAATGHGPDGQPIAGRWHVYPEKAAAGLWSTAGDLAQLLLSVQGSLHGKKNALISQASASDMLRELSGSQGLGFAVGGKGDSAYFRHDGATHGFEASMIGFQHRGQGAVIMTNSTGGLSLAHEILRSIALVYEWPALKPKIRDVVALASEKVARIEGTYEAADDNSTVVTIELRNGEVLVSSTYWVGERALYASSESHFFTLEGDWEMEFSFDDSGCAVTSLTFGPVLFVRSRS